MRGGAYNPPLDLRRNLPLVSSMADRGVSEGQAADLLARENIELRRQIVALCESLGEIRATVARP